MSGLRDMAFDVAMAARRYPEDQRSRHNYVRLAARANMKEESRAAWCEASDRFASQLCIVRKETGDTVSKAAIVVEGLRLGMSAVSR